MNSSDDSVGQVDSWTQGQIGQHLENQLKMFYFRTWADWKRHAEEVCELCRAVLKRLEALGVDLPEDTMPIRDVINQLKKG